MEKFEKLLGGLGLTSPSIKYFNKPVYNSIQFTIHHCWYVCLYLIEHTFVETSSNTTFNIITINIITSLNFQYFLDLRRQNTPSRKLHAVTVIPVNMYRFCTRYGSLGVLIDNLFKTFDKLVVVIPVIYTHLCTPLPFLLRSIHTV